MKLKELAGELCQKLKEAKEARQKAGIEEKWAYCEDAYNSQDEATKGAVRVYKPATPDGPFIEPKKQEWQRSTAFVNITRPYVDVASARIAEMLVPTDDRNWELKPTPKKDIEVYKPLIEALPEEEALAKFDELLEKIEDQVEECQKQIDDWLIEANWPDKQRIVIHDAARIGTGIIKGPISAGDKPGVRIVEAIDFFPSPDCGEDIQDAEYIFEREKVSKRALRRYMEQENKGWLPDEILECLKEGPKEDKQKFCLWHYSGEVGIEELFELGCEIPEDLKEYPETKLWAQLTLCNERIIRAFVSPVQGEFTYRVLNWQRRHGYWAGIGVAEQLEIVQRALNAAVRNLLDNAALSALPQIVFWKGVINPVDGRFEIKPGKVWQVAGEDVTIQDVKNAIMTIEIPTREGELMAIIGMLRDVAQEVTGLPLVVVGTGSSGAVGTDQLQTNAATIVLRRLAREFDYRLTKPLIEAFYRWLKEYTDLAVPEAEVDVRGSSVLVERDIQAQALIQMIQLSVNPVYGLDPKLVAREWMRSQKFDPKKVELTPEREAEMMEALAKPDEKAMATVESARLRATALTEQAKAKTEATLVAKEMQLADAEREREHDMRMLDLEYKYKVIEYALKQNIDIQTAMEQIAAIEVPES